jgi:hypothetical protein
VESDVLPVEGGVITREAFDRFVEWMSFYEGEPSLIDERGRGHMLASFWAGYCLGIRSPQIAAQLAKIQALTEALENLLEDTGIKDAIWLVESKPGDEVDDEDARTMACVSAARAALSLPSA